MKHFRLGCCSLPRLRWRAAAVSLMVILAPTINAYCVFFNMLGHFDADGTSVATLVDILILQLSSVNLTLCGSTVCGCCNTRPSKSEALLNMLNATMTCRFHHPKTLMRGDAKGKLRSTCFNCVCQRQVETCANANVGVHTGTVIHTVLGVAHMMQAPLFMGNQITVSPSSCYRVVLADFKFVGDGSPLTVTRVVLMVVIDWSRCWSGDAEASSCHSRCCGLEQPARRSAPCKPCIRHGHSACRSHISSPT